MSKEQEDIFKEIIGLKVDIQHLAGYVQNDIEDMMVNHGVTEKDVLISADDMKKAYNEVISKLNTSYYKSKALMLSHTKQGNEKV